MYKNNIVFELMDENELKNASIDILEKEYDKTEKIINDLKVEISALEQGLEIIGDYIKEKKEE